MTPWDDRSLDVLCVGLAVGNVAVRPVSSNIFNVDTTQVEEIAMMGGGDAFNQASVLAALGHKASLISKMADDASGNMMRDLLKQRGVDTSLVAKSEDLGTSTCIVLIREDGQRTFCTYKGCLRTFGTNDIDFSALDNAKIVSIGGLFALPSFDQETSIELFKKAREAGTITVADTKYDAFHIGFAGIKNLLEYTDYFFPSYDEASYLSGLKDPTEIAMFFRDHGAKNVGVKLGGDGCYVLADSFKGFLPAFKTKVIDTTGAGDNFMAGLIHGILNKWDIADCALYASATGALAVTRMGATSDSAYIEPINDILSGTTEGLRLLKEVINK